MSCVPVVAKRWFTWRQFAEQVEKVREAESPAQHLYASDPKGLAALDQVMPGVPESLRALGTIPAIGIHSLYMKTDSTVIPACPRQGRQVSVVCIETHIGIL
jgi:hypothetical protein